MTVPSVILTSLHCPVSMQAGLIQDVKTRNSAYNMLEKAWEMKVAVRK